MYAVRDDSNWTIARSYLVEQRKISPPLLDVPCRKEPHGPDGLGASDSFYHQRTKGDASPIEQLLASLFGKDRDSFFEKQFVTFVGWVLHVRDAIRNHEQHLPGRFWDLSVRPTAGKACSSPSSRNVSAGGKPTLRSGW
jgi:hypothetical protein